MRNCSYCGAPLDDDALFCTSCGRAIESQDKLCPNCGAIIEEDSVFCANCGTKLNSQMSPSVNPQENDEAQMSESGKRKDITRLSWGICACVIIVGIVLINRILLSDNEHENKKYNPQPPIIEEHTEKDELLDIFVFENMDKKDNSSTDSTCYHKATHNNNKHLDDSSSDIESSLETVSSESNRNDINVEMRDNDQNDNDTNTKEKNISINQLMKALNK